MIDNHFEINKSLGMAPIGRDFSQFKEEALSKLSEHKTGYIYSVALYDIKRFSLFNELYGIEEGNKVLKDLFEYLESMEMCSISAHIYADRFIALMKIPQYAAGVPWAQIHQLQLNDFIRKQKKRYTDCPLEISCGVSKVETDASQFAAALSNADFVKAVASKRTGTNCLWYSNNISYSDLPLKSIFRGDGSGVYYNKLAEITKLTFYEYSIEEDFLTFVFPPDNPFQLPHCVEKYFYRLQKGEPFEFHKAFPDLNVRTTDTAEELWMEMEWELPGKRNSWIRSSACLIRDEKGSPQTFVGYLQDITREKKLENKAQFDEMTGVLNKASFENRCIEFLNTAGEGKEHALFFLDLDRFKKVNDEKGHQYGDKTLKTMGTVLKNVFRSDDVVGRVGGDEFLVLMKNVNDVNNVKLKAEAVSKAFKQKTDWDSGQVITCSIGISIGTLDAGNYKEAVKKADEALYRAKAEGRDQYFIYS